MSANASIANLFSAAGRFGFSQRTPYAAAKWGVIGFSRSLSIELGEHAIVFLVSPIGANISGHALPVDAGTQALV